MNEIKVGDIIEVVVTGIQKYGAFVLIDDKYDGLIHISEISKDEAGIVDLKIKKEENDNLSNSITYVIPIEKGIKQVKAKHVN